MENNRMLTGILLFADYEEKLSVLTAEEKGNLLDAIFRYNRTGEVPENMPKLVQVIFSFIKDDIDRNREKYKNICERNRENGKHGGRPKKQEENPVGLSDNPNNLKDKDKDNPKDNPKESEKDNAAQETNTHTQDIADISQEQPPQQLPSQKDILSAQPLYNIPTMEQVCAYCLEKQLTVNPDAFYNYYSSTGWTVNGVPIADWQAKLRYWDAKDRQEGKTAAVNRYPTMQNYDPLAGMEHLFTRIV